MMSEHCDSLCSVMANLCVLSSDQKDAQEGAYIQTPKLQLIICRLARQHSRKIHIKEIELGDSLQSDNVASKQVHARALTNTLAIVITLAVTRTVTLASARARSDTFILVPKVAVNHTFSANFLDSSCIAFLRVNVQLPHAA